MMPKDEWLNLGGVEYKKKCIKHFVEILSFSAKIQSEIRDWFDELRQTWKDGTTGTNRGYFQLVAAFGGTHQVEYCSASVFFKWMKDI